MQDISFRYWTAQSPKQTNAVAVSTSPNTHARQPHCHNVTAPRLPNSTTSDGLASTEGAEILNPGEGQEKVGS
jgi:hypothetical protein